MNLDLELRIYEAHKILYDSYKKSRVNIWLQCFDTRTIILMLFVKWENTGCRLGKLINYYLQQQTATLLKIIRMRANLLFKTNDNK